MEDIELEEEQLENNELEIAEKEELEYGYGKMEDKPQIEQDLFKLQDEYFEKRNKYDNELEKYRKGEIDDLPEDESQEVWGRMLEKTYEYCKSFVKQRCKHKYRPPEEVTDKSIQAAYLFMNQYIKNPNFLIDVSFGGMIQPKVVEAMYKKTKNDDNLSLNSQCNDKNEFMDMQISSLNEEYYLDENLENFGNPTLDKIVFSILNEADEVLNDSRLSFIIRLWVFGLLSCPKNRHAKPLFIKEYSTDNFKVENLLNLINTEVYNRCS